MSKLPAVRAQDVIRIAERFKFRFDRPRGSHAVDLRASDQRRIVIPVHQGQELKPGSLRGPIDDMALSADQFVGMP